MNLGCPEGLGSTRIPCDVAHSRPETSLKMAASAGLYDSDSSDNLYMLRHLRPSIDRSSEDLSDSEALLLINPGFRPPFDLLPLSLSPAVS